MCVGIIPFPCQDNALSLPFSVRFPTEALPARKKLQVWLAAQEGGQYVMKIASSVKSRVHDQSLFRALATQGLGVSLPVTLVVHSSNMDVTHGAFAQFIHKFTPLFYPTLIQEFILISCADRLNGDIEPHVLCHIKNAQERRLAGSMVQEGSNVHSGIDRYPVDLLDDHSRLDRSRGGDQRSFLDDFLNSKPRPLVVAVEEGTQNSGRIGILRFR